MREALRQLEAEGLVTFTPHYGAVVSSLSLAEIEELCQLRALLESELIRIAVPNLTDEDHQLLDEILDAYDAAFKQQDIAERGGLNWRFHSALLWAANRPLTLNVLNTLHNQSDRYMRMQLALTHGEDTASGEHREIAKAARAGEADRAAKLVRKHVMGAGDRLIEFLRVQRDAARAAEGTNHEGGK